MKIIQISNVHLGRSFEGQGLVGDKLRLGIKQAFSRVIDLAISEKAQLVILAGDTFDSLDVSQSMLDFFISEIRRLNNIPVVMLPGSRDYYRNGSFWDEWRITKPAANLYMLIDAKTPVIEFPEISCSIYGYPSLSPDSSDNPLSRLNKTGKSKHHIAVVYGNIVTSELDKEWNFPLGIEDLFASSFDYVALGGQLDFRNYADIGLKAAYSGSPEIISPEQSDSGNAIILDIDKGGPIIQPIKTGEFIWRDALIHMETIINVDDLERRLKEMKGPNVLLKATLEGLTLFESGLNTRLLQEDLENDFLHLEFIDHTNVLPENVSEVRVSEKTMLGQYLKLMVDRLNSADEVSRPKLEQALKLGYILLSGRDIR